MIVLTKVISLIGNMKLYMNISTHIAMFSKNSLMYQTLSWPSNKNGSIFFSAESNQDNGFVKFVMK